MKKTVHVSNRVRIGISRVLLCSSAMETLVARTTVRSHVFTGSAISARQSTHFCRPEAGFVNAKLQFCARTHPNAFNRRLLRQDWNAYTQLTISHASSQAKDVNEFRESLQALSPLAQVAQACHERDKDRFPLMLEPWINTDAHTSAEGEIQLSKNISISESPMRMQSSSDYCEEMKLFEAVWQGINKLEDDLLKSQEASYGNDTCYSGLWEAEHKVHRLELELCRMQQNLDFKERCLTVALCEARDLQNRLIEAELQILSARKFKEATEARQAEELLQRERLFESHKEILDKHMVTMEAMHCVQEIILKFQASISHLQNNFLAEKVVKILQEESSFFFQALLVAMQALSRAEEQVTSLREHLRNTEEALETEEKACSNARQWVEKLEQALADEESKVDDLFVEVASFKAVLEQKEMLLQELSDEAAKNANMLATGKKNTEALHLLEKRVEQLIAQINVLETQVQSKDVLLDEIKGETFRSTEVLKVAAQIKQDLNASRQREVELMEELERQNSLVKELHQELNCNSRAMKAEQALRKAEKTAKELAEEINILRKGLQSRDKAIKVMQDEIDRSIHILSSAAENREEMQKMQVYINNLESKLKEKT